MTTPIIERLSLSELKEFVTQQDLSSKYTMDNPSRFITLTTADGIDNQTGYNGFDATAKLWIQYFPLANQFALNVNFFAIIDGAPLNPEDFLRLVPIGETVVNYVNGLKIQWIKNNNGVYVKHSPEDVAIRLTSDMNNIYIKPQT